MRWLHPHFRLHLPEAPDKAAAGKATNAWPAAISAALAQRSGRLSYDDAITLICRVTNWPVGHVWTRGDTGWRSGAWYSGETHGAETHGAETHGAETHTADAQGAATSAGNLVDADAYQTLREATALTDLGSGRGIVAAVLHLGSCRFLPGLEGLGSPLRRQAAAALDLRGVIGVPVLAGHSVVAVLEFVTAHEVEPDGELAEALLDVAARCQRRPGRTTRPAKAMIPVQGKPADVPMPHHLAG